MTRTVRDNALLLQVIAGHDPSDPGSSDEPVPDYGAMLGQNVRGLRMGVTRHFYTRHVTGDPEQVEGFELVVPPSFSSWPDSPRGDHLDQRGG